MPDQLSLLAAAKLLQATRDDILKGRLGSDLLRVSDAGKSIDVGISRDGNQLIITGSSGWKDYAFYNIRPRRAIPDMVEIDQLTSPDLPQKAFHQGFLLHACRIKEFLGDHMPDGIIGHSLGAASAQILGTALNIPTICLASPQVIKRRFLERDALRNAAHPQWNVFNLAWRQDFVTHGYRSLGFRCLGHRVVVDTQMPNTGIDHFVKDYEKLIISAAAYDVEGVPQHWPDPSFPMPTRLA